MGSLWCYHGTNNRDEITTDTKYSDSVTFENLGDDILDFSETNPFGVMT